MEQIGNIIKWLVKLANTALMLLFLKFIFDLITNYQKHLLSIKSKNSVDILEKRKLRKAIQKRLAEFLTVISTRSSNDLFKNNSVRHFLTLSRNVRIYDDKLSGVLKLFSDLCNIIIKGGSMLKNMSKEYETKTFEIVEETGKLADNLVSTEFDSRGLFQRWKIARNNRQLQKIAKQISKISKTRK